MSTAALRTVQKNSKGDRIWNTSTQEERERIKEFWLSLKEDERKSLVKIEKEAVLRLNTDPHAPASLRAIGAPSNMEAFASAYQCKPGDAMVRPTDKQVKIW